MGTWNIKWMYHIQHLREGAKITLGESVERKTIIYCDR